MGEVIFEPYLAEVLELSAPELELLHSTGRADAAIQLARLRWWNGDALTPIELLQEPAHKGVPVAQYLLGTYLRFKRRDMQASMLWLSKAADAGHPAAQELLAGYYSDGSGGFPKNQSLSFQRYLAAARQGLANAQMNVGTMYCMGVGIEKNNAQGVAWFMNSQQRSTKPLPPSAAGCQ